MVGTSYGRQARALTVGVLILIGGMALGLLRDNAYFLSVGATVGITAIAAMGLSLLVGGAGQLSFGQAGFMAIGAYSSAYIIKTWHFPFLVGVLIAAIAAAIVGLVVGAIALRLKGNYLAMATLAAGALIYGLLSLDGPLGGPNGFTGIPAIAIGPWQLISPMSQYVFVLVIIAVIYSFCVWIFRTRFGLELAAIRDDEIGAASVGINIVARKVQIFVFSSVLAGIAGAVDASLQTTISPSLFGVSTSIQLFLMVVLGGLGSIPGAILGTVVVLGILQVVSGTGDYALTVMGIAVVAGMAFFPGGIAGIFGSANRWISDKSHFSGGKKVAGSVTLESGAGE